MHAVYQVIIGASLPGIALVVLIVLLRRYERDVRSAILSASLIWGTLLAASSELLSIGNSLTASSLLAIWLLLDLVLIGLYLRMRMRRDKPVPAASGVPFSPFDWIALVSIALIVALVGVIAIVAAPNNWDSMTYHMGRVVHWIQNRDADFYATAILRQLYQKPWAEYAIMHFQLLSGGDRLANIVQWLAMLGSIAGVSLIARELGADRRGQIFAAVVCATIPMGILQGSSTQNDYVVCFWMVCFVYYVVSLARKSDLDRQSRLRSATDITPQRRGGTTEPWSSLHPLGIGTSLGLAFLTKGTAYVYSIPFFLWYMLLAWNKLGFRAWRPIALVGAIILAFNLGHEVRNWDVFGRPLSSGDDPIANERIGVPSFASNVIRNLAIHAGMRSAESAVLRAHKWLNIDVHDPRTTVDKFVVPRLTDLYETMHEDHAGNPLHLLAIFGAIALFLARRSLRGNRIAFAYMAAVVMAFLLLCLLLRWAPHHSRIQLSLFVLFAPFIGLVLTQIAVVRARLVVVILILAALPWVFLNRSRPLLFEVLRGQSTLFTTDYTNIFSTDRVTQMFRNRPELRNDYVGAAKFLKAQGCFDIGLSMDHDDWEYPLWVLLEAGLPGSRYRLEHIGVRNASRKKLDPSFQPCAVVAIGNPSDLRQEEAEFKASRGRYIKQWSSGGVHVYVRASS
jgi:hypothetical protein